jgi:Na+/H+-dicarboxylate symporter
MYPSKETGLTKTKMSAVIDNFLQILAIRVLLLLCLSLVVGVAQLDQNKYFKKVAFNYFIYAGDSFLNHCL